MYNNPYINNYNQQSNIDRINNQIAELEKIKAQIPQQQVQQPTNLTQNFQLTPVNNNVIKYANSINDVEKSVVIGDTPFFSNDMSVVWIKNTKGNVKTFELVEIEPKDEKDLQIELLQQQINELKGMINDEKFDGNVVGTEITTNSTANDKTTRKSVEASKPASIQRVPTSKKK
jgi:hypothetical protein